MSKKKSFYVVYPADKRLKSLISGIRILADEHQRTEAHITIRGPYIRRLSKTHFTKFSELVKNSKVDVSGIGSFFEQDQNTVFLTCQSEALRPAWNKRTYKDFNPHITIYNGNDRKWACEIMNILNKNFSGFSFEILKLEWLRPNDKGELEVDYLKSQLDFSIVSKFLGTEITYKHIKNISKGDRLLLINKLSQSLFRSANEKACI